METQGGAGSVHFFAVICTARKGAHDCHVKCMFLSGTPSARCEECLADKKCSQRKQVLVGQLAGSSLICQDFDSSCFGSGFFTVLQQNEGSRPE